MAILTSSTYGVVQVNHQMTCVSIMVVIVPAGPTGGGGGSEIKNII